MGTFNYISARGDKMSLTDNQYFTIINIEGQTQSDTSISSSVIGGIDGDTINNVQAQPRSVVLTLKLKQSENVEVAKRYILQFVKIKQIGTIEWTQNDRTLLLSGTVESIEMPRWEAETLMVVTLYCSQPFWEDFDYVIQEISDAVNLHYFTESNVDMLYFTEEGRPLGAYDTIRTKALYNNGDVSVGMEIAINAVSTVTNPIIYDGAGNFFGVGYGTDTKQLVMESGDIVVITTLKGNKTVTLNGVNIFDKIKPNSKWLQLASGQNQFTINSDDESTSNMYFHITYKQRYV